MTARMPSLVSALIALPLSLSALQQAPTVEGRWEAELKRWNGEEHVQLNLRVRFDGERSNWGNSHEATELPELAAALRRSGREDVSFSLTREAGRIDFTGTSNGDEAGGEFRWTGSASFRSAMAGLGYDDLAPRHQFSMTMQDITVAFTRAMHDRGYDVPVEDLVRFGIFDVTPEFVDGLALLGHREVPSDMLVRLRIHDVSPAYISDMAEAGYSGSLDDYVRFSIHDVNVDFARAMARTFGREVTADDLVRFQIHDIDAGYVETLNALGGFDLEMDDVVRMRIHDVTPGFIREMGAAGYLDLSADDLVRFQIHDVDADFVRRLESEGHRNLTPDELVSAKIMGKVRRRSP